VDGFRSIIRLLFSQINIIRARVRRRNWFLTNYISILFLLLKRPITLTEKH
jgi:hypothetical protein